LGAEAVGRRERTIVEIEVRPVDFPLTEPFAISTGAPEFARNVLVRITLDDGTQGYGEAAPFEAVSGETQAGSLAALHLIADELTGRDAAAWRPLASHLADVARDAPAARCAAEQAVIDALARHARMPLPNLFGGPVGSLSTDLTIPASDIDHAVLSAEHAYRLGFRTVKVKAGAEPWEADVERLAALSSAVPQLTMIVDANGGFAADEARGLLTALRRRGIGLRLLEQPVPADDTATLGQLQHEFGVPVCADEAARSPADVLRLAGSGGVDVINVKVMKCGVTQALDMIAIARAGNMSCMIGGMVETAVSMSFSAALAMAYGDVFTFVDLDTPLFMADAGISGGIRYAGPAISFPDSFVGTGVDASAHFE
jgi:L-alanine-DL-glutamate epimerase-like enolase superfamily enzyme